MKSLENSLLAFGVSFLLNPSLFAQEPSLLELQAYTAQRYHVDFNAQTDKSKTDIANEYSENSKLGDILLSGAMKDDVDLKIASRMLAIEIWEQKFMQSAQVDDAEVKAVFEKYQPKTATAYRLRNILVKSEEKADTLMKTLLGIKDSAKRLKRFKELVKNDSEDIISRKNEGESGWIDFNRLDSSLQGVLKDKKVNDLGKAQIKDIGWQVILIEEIKPEHQATYEEAKAQLTMAVKQEHLKQAISKILENK